MTIESNSTLPSSRTSVGIFISGLSGAILRSGAAGWPVLAMRSMRSASPHSIAVIITLRTNGEAGE
jgi:hypothetical protein